MLTRDENSKDRFAAFSNNVSFVHEYLESECLDESIALDASVPERTLLLDNFNLKL